MPTNMIEAEIYSMNINEIFMRVIWSCAEFARGYLSLNTRKFKKSYSLMVKLHLTAKWG